MSAQMRVIPSELHKSCILNGATKQTPELLHKLVTFYDKTKELNESSWRKNCHFVAFN